MPVADETEAAALLAADLVERISPLLAGKGSAAQGAALADLLAIWLTGHIVIGDRAETRKLRAELLSSHLTAVRQLVDLADRAAHG